MARGILCVLFPINVAPDILSNTVVFMFNRRFAEARGKEPSNLWPVISFLSPFMGPISGIFDAAGGYPFWDPLALDEHRVYWWISRSD